MDSDGQSAGEKRTALSKAWRTLRAGVEWFADTFRGHAHVRDVKEERK